MAKIRLEIIAEEIKINTNTDNTCIMISVYDRNPIFFWNKYKTVDYKKKEDEYINSLFSTMEQSNNKIL
jgi:hypothetical protein